MKPNTTLVEATPGVATPPASQPIAEVTNVRINETSQEGQEKEIRQNPQSHDGRDEGCLSEVGAPAFHQQKPFEGMEMEHVPAELLAGYLGVSVDRATSLRQVVIDLKCNPAIKTVLLLKCQVTADWKVYPLGKKDGVMDAVERYFRILKEEANVFHVEWQLKKSLMDDEKGFSEARLHKLITEIPTNLRAILNCFEGFFDDAKGLNRLLQNLPGLKAIK